MNTAPSIIRSAQRGVFSKEFLRLHDVSGACTDALQKPSFPLLLVYSSISSPALSLDLILSAMIPIQPVQFASALYLFQFRHCLTDEVRCPHLLLPMTDSLERNDQSWLPGGKEASSMGQAEKLSFATRVFRLRNPELPALQNSYLVIWNCALLNVSCPAATGPISFC